MSVKLRFASIHSYRLLFYMIVLFALSSLIVLLLSTSTSFLYSYKEQLDSVVYQVIGREWLNGFLPYRDLWDLKGPLIFIINAFGFLLTGSRYGILFIQILFLYISLLLVFLYLREKFSTKMVFVEIIMICSVLSVVYEGGNMVEEYILPLLMCSFIQMNRWLGNLKGGGGCHKWNYAFVYGITFAFAFLTRLTNALPLCAGCIYIALFLIYKKKWMNVLQNVSAFLIGFIFIVIPFFVYFYFNDTLADYFEVLEFGFRYFGQSGHSVQIKNIILFNFPVFFMMIVVFVRTYYNHNVHQLSLWGLVSVVSLYWVVNSRGYYHYSLIYLPYLIISFYEIASLDKKYRRMAFIIVLLYIIRGIKHDLNYYNRLDDVKAANLVVKQMVDKLSVADRDNIIIYGDIIVPYLYDGICPNKYFYLQDENAGISPYYKAKMLRDFERVNPKYVIAGVAVDYIQDILNNNYSVYYSNPQVIIYQRLFFEE